MASGILINCACLGHGPTPLGRVKGVMPAGLRLPIPPKPVR